MDKQLAGEDDDGNQVELVADDEAEDSLTTRNPRRRAALST